MTEQPLVSVLMNCYNGDRYLREAIDSVRAQTYQNWELVFWDNRSTDRSAEIFKSYADSRMNYLLAPEHTDLGGGRARAWTHLTGDLVAVLDTDDLWLPNKLEKQVPLFADPEVGVVISDIDYFNERTSKPRFSGKYPPTGWVFEEMLMNYFAPLLSVVIRRSIAASLPRAFDGDFSGIADFDLVVRMSRVSKVAMYHGVLARTRVHSGSITWQNAQPFLAERERWIAKQIGEEPEFAVKYRKAVALFVSANQRSRAMVDLLAGRRLRALRALANSRFDHWHSWVLLAACLLPFAGTVYVYRKKRQFELA